MWYGFNFKLRVFLIGFHIWYVCYSAHLDVCCIHALQIKGILALNLHVTARWDRQMLMEVLPRSVRVQYYEHVPRIWSIIITVTNRHHITSGVNLCSRRLHVDFKPLIFDKSVCPLDWCSLLCLCQCVCCAMKTLWARVVGCVFRRVLLKITPLWKILNFEGGKSIVCELGAGWRGILLVSKIRRGKECVAIALPVCRPFRNFCRDSCVFIESYVQNIFMWLKFTCVSYHFH